MRVRDEALHFLLGAAVAELEVVQHGVVLFREALVRVLEVLHRRAEGVRVVAHVDHGRIGVLGRLDRVAAQRGDERGREAGHLLHVPVGAHAGRLVGCVGVLQHRVLRLLELLPLAGALLDALPGHGGVVLERLAHVSEYLLDAADDLLVGRVGVHAHAGHRRDTGSHCRYSGRDKRCGRGGRLAELSLDAAGDAVDLAGCLVVDADLDQEIEKVHLQHLQSQFDDYVRRDLVAAPGVRRLCRAPHELQVGLGDVARLHGEADGLRQVDPVRVLLGLPAPARGQVPSKRASTPWSGVLAQVEPEQLRIVGGY